MEDLLKKAVIIIFLLLASQLFAHPESSKPPIGIPFRQSFTSKDYNAGPQNWSIVQDKRGIMYVGNSFGVLEYDGVDWRLIETPIGSDVFALAIDTFGVVFVGLTNEFGYLSSDWNGNPVYKSLSDSLEHNFGQILQIIPLHDDVYFVAEQMQIFKYDGKKTTRVVKTESYFTGLLNSSIIIQKYKTGFFKIEDTTLVKIPVLDKIKDQIVVSVLPYLADKDGNRQHLFITSQSTFYIYNGKEIKILSSEIESLFKKYYVYDAIFLPGNLYALAIDPFGVVIVDHEGKLIYSIDLESNLISQSALTLFGDRQNGLWIGTNDGINRFEFPTPFQTLFSETGVRGGVTDLKRFNDDLYISTLGRVYRLKKEPDKSKIFSPSFSERFGLETIKKINAWTWGMAKAADNLLLATDVGLYAFDKQNKLSFPLKHHSFFSIKKSNTNNNMIFLTSHDSLFSVLYKNKNWTIEKSIFLGQNGNFSIAESPDNVLWINSYERGNYRVDLRNGLDSIEIKRYTTSDGLPENNYNYFANYNAKLFFLTKVGVYSFNNQADSFEVDSVSLIGKTFIGKDLNNITKDQQGNFFVTTLKNIFFFRQKDDGSFFEDDSSFARISEFSAEIVLPEADGTIWFGGSQGIIKYNPDYLFKTQDSFKTLFRSIYLGEDLFFNGDWRITRAHKTIPRMKRGISYHAIDFDANNVKFKYAINSYHQIKYNQYQYFLEGFEPGWSDWSSKPEREYTSLPIGKFIFNVRSKNADNFIAKEAKFYFEVLPPWYKTIWAYLCYIILTIFLIVGIVKWRSFGLKKLVKERTKELTDANMQLIKAKAQAEQAAHSKSIFLATMSHEIRTPLNGILGMNQLLANSQLDDEQADYIDSINVSAESLLNLINDILDFSKIEAGQIELEKIEFTLIPFMENVLKILKGSAEKKGLNISLSIGTKLPAIVIGDPYRIKQILLNFGSNAIKFTKSGQIIVSLTGEKVETESENLANKIKLCFKISDSGIGIKKEKQKNIFSSFSQADSSTTREYGGTGLGLTISKLLAELMGGTVHFKSTFGKGSSFWTDIVLEYPKNQKKQTIKIEKPKGLSIDNLNNIRILVAEDNSINQKFIKRLLEKNNAKVEIANHGREALEMFQANTYDIILMDVNMPVMDGYEATRQIRKSEKNGRIPIIALTANAIKGDKELCIEADMDDYLTKPVKITDLIETIKLHLK